MVVITPVLFLLMFTAIQVALISYARSIALAAAQNAARAEAAYQAPAGAGQNAVNAFIAQTGDGLTFPQVSVQRTAVQVNVTVTGTAISVVPLVPGWTVTQSASEPIEQFTR